MALTCKRIDTVDPENFVVKVFPAEADEMTVGIEFIGKDGSYGESIMFDFTVEEISKFAEAVLELSTHAKALRNCELMGENIKRRYKDE